MTTNGVHVEKVRKRRYRAPKRTPDPGERFQLGARVTAETKMRLDAECEKNGRSISQQAEMHIMRSMWLEDLLQARLITMRIPAGSKKD